MQKCGNLHQLCQLVLLAQSCGWSCSRRLCLLSGHLVVWFLALRDRLYVDLLSIYSVLDSITHTQFTWYWEQIYFSYGQGNGNSGRLMDQGHMTSKGQRHDSSRALLIPR